MAHEADSITQWLHKYTEKQGDCLVFSGYKMPNRTKAGGLGYGRLSVGGKTVLAHRHVASMIGLQGTVRHTCDNRPCCNPAHLVGGTQQDNLIDKSMRSPRTGTTLKLTPEQVLEVRGRMDKGESPTALAPEYGVTPENLMSIRARKTWAHLKEAP